VKKWASDLSWHCSIKKQKWPKTDEEDPTVPGYKGNANQTTLRIHLTLLEWLSSRTENNKCCWGWECEK
jgi:hypothetical protein